MRVATSGLPHGRILPFTVRVRAIETDFGYKVVLPPDSANPNLRREAYRCDADDLERIVLVTSGPENEEDLRFGVFVREGSLWRATFAYRVKTTYEPGSIEAIAFDELARQPSMADFIRKRQNDLYLSELDRL